MPLSPPKCERVAAYTRSIPIRACARSAGWWDIEGHLADAWPEPVAVAGITGSVVLQALLREIGGNSDEKPISIDGCHASKSSGPQMAGSFPCWFQPEPECAPASAADI